MKKAIFLTLLFSGLISLSLLFSVTDTALALECTQDADCANESICFSGTGLTYGDICCTGTEDCGVDWLNGNCATDAKQIRVDAWCEESCCDSYCEATYGTNYIGVCFNSSVDTNACSCTEGSGSPPGTSKVPRLDFPGDGARNISLRPTFTWRAVEGASNYSIWYGVNDQLPEQSITTIGTVGTSVTLFRDLDENTIYHWMVGVQLESGGSEYISSEIRSFRTVSSDSTPSPTPDPGTPSGSVCPSGQICNPLAYDTVEDIIKAISRFLFQIGMVLAPVMLIIAGVMFVTSAGSPGGVQKAKSLALYTLIGLAVILLASGLIAVLQSILGSS